MKTKFMKSSLMVSTTICGVLAGFAGLGLVSSASAAEKADAPVDVVVTGSRIKSPNRKSIAPITSVGQEDIKNQGITRVEDLVNSLPQSFAAQGANISNGASGTATVNLRALGANRTLVTINGRRLGPGTPGSTAADLNFIPTPLVKRVDVLTGGGAAVYGSDAMGGVVNFVMDDSFNGFSFDYNYGAYSHKNNNAASQAANHARGFGLPKSDVWDGRTKQYSLALGTSTPDGKGHVNGYMTYLSVDAVLEADRDYSACTLNSGASFSCGGSGTAFPARIGSQQVSLDGQTLVARSPAYVYNFGPTNYFQRPDERYSGGFFANYKINEHATAYSEFMFMHDYSVAQIAPGGIFAFGGDTATGGFMINCNNAFATAAQLTTMCGAALAGTSATVDEIVARRNVEGGGRQSTFENTDYRLVGGMRGNITKGWDYDAYYSYYSSSSYSQQKNYFVTPRISAALQAVRNGAGQIVCANGDPTCVPYNIFNPSGVTQAMLNYLQAPGSSKGALAEKILNASVTGNLGEYGVNTPWAKDGVRVAFGLEHRADNSQFEADYLSQQGLLSGAGGASPTVNGATQVDEVFGEVNVPLVQDAAWARSLAFEGNVRSSNYKWHDDLAHKGSAKATNYQFGIDYLPVDQFRVRLSYERATRAPNINELFSPQYVQLDGSTDPCVGGVGFSPATPTATAAQCAAMGVTAAQYGHLEPDPANQYNGLTGGNYNLKPEIADTKTFGFVYQPSFLKGLTASVDYFDIKLKNTIGTIGADNILANCVATGAANWCSLVHRDASGSIRTVNGYVIDTNLNAITGNLIQRGYDLNADYSHSLGSYGSLATSIAGTYATVNGAPGVGNNCVGLYGVICGTPAPKWRHKARATWTTPWYGIKLSTQWRYFGKVTNDQGTAAAPTDAAFSAKNYIDMSFTMPIMKHYTLRIGANNIFDVTPPIVGASACPTGPCNGNVFAQTYDALGRYSYINLSTKF